MQAISCSHSLAARPPVPVARVAAARASRAPLGRFVAVRAADTRSGADQNIEGLPASYCDDFECTSSPAVEASVRQLAKDLQRANGTWSPIYASNFEYQDPFRRFKGPEGVSQLDFVPTSVQGAQVAVTSMKMLDNSAAQIQWRLTGSLGPLPVDVAGTTEITMNLLTGRVERLSERWDVSRCSPPAAAAWNAARAVWAAKQAGKDAGRVANQTLDSLTSIDDEDTYQAPNPNDPMRFFQQKDDTKQDALLFVGVLTLFYVLVQGWGKLFTSGGGF